MQSTTSFSVALQLPPNRSTLVRHMLDGAASELRERGIFWRVVEATADVTFRLGRSEADEHPGHLYADLRRPERDVARLRIDGPLRTAAVTSVLSRIARLLRGETSAQGATSALRWLEQWDALSAAMQHVVFHIGDAPVATLAPQVSTWHPLDRDATPDIDHLVERMVRESFSLRLPDRLVAPAAAGVALKPLLWQMALLAGPAGRMRCIAPRARLRLKGWPYLATGGPKSFGELIRRLRGDGLSTGALDGAGIAPPDELDGFLNACHVCGFLQVETMPASAPVLTQPLARHDMQIGTQASGPLRGAPAAGKVGRVISSIRRSLGMGAG